MLIRDLESQEILGQAGGGRKVRRDLGLDPHFLPEKTAVMGKTNKTKPKSKSKPKTRVDSRSMELLNPDHPLYRLQKDHGFAISALISGQ